MSNGNVSLAILDSSGPHDLDNQVSKLQISFDMWNDEIRTGYG
jgi:hypothetical protein